MITAYCLGPSGKAQMLGFPVIANHLYYRSHGIVGTFGSLHVDTGS
jgi:hypothetical protein